MPTGWRTWRNRRWLVTVAAAACLAGAWLVIRDWRATDAAADRAASRLDATRASLHRTEDELATAEGTADARWASLEAEVEALGSRRAERSDAQGTLDAAGAQLADLQDRLAAANVELAASTGRLAALQECMVGVTEALNQIGARDMAGLARTLRAIDGTCTEAGVAL